jgi:hypothetical protein
LGALADDVTDAIAKELGIKEWYSLHLMDMCEGTYKPNATAKGAAKNVSRCSNQTAMCKLFSFLIVFGVCLVAKEVVHFGNRIRYAVYEG